MTGPAEPPAGAGWLLEVDPASAGLRLDLFLSLRIHRLSRARAARLRVVDLDEPDRSLRKSQTVRAGQRLWVERPLPDGDAETSAPVVLHADADLLVLAKPPDLAVHPTASRFVRTVTHWLATTTPEGTPRPEPAHRLDVETSGVLVCGRHALAIRALKQLFADQHVQKRYLAVVEGRPAWDETLVDQPLGPATDSAVRIKMGPGDLPAVTALKVVARGGRRSMVEARPVSGRQHQIRVHLALLGHPIVGDKLYGPDEGLFLAHLDRPLDDAELGRLGHPRHALHAAEVALPWRGEVRRFQAAWPAELDALWQD
ncbi:MAG: RluA family pseudouridine synthase [Myxococcales bacterium]|nr:RluA family pseudouridine synthase [Myxococcales bacterium]MCB9549547.1 RluA family pseudouridine synthase [Myxococcales bacterium]